MDRRDYCPSASHRLLRDLLQASRSTQLKLKYWTETEDNELLARAWRAANMKARELGWIANSCSLKPGRQLNDKERE
jgi:hypothetical protein